MSLVKCNECGKEISDKSNSCIHCGSPLKQDNLCPECGKKVKDNKCNNCGYELKSNEDKNVVESTVVVSDNKNVNKTLQILLWGFIGLIAVVFIVACIGDSTSNKYEEYYNAKIEACPNRTLRVGINELTREVGTESDYEIYESKSSGGYNMVYLSFYGYYTPLKLEDGYLSFGAVYNETTNQVEWGESFIEGLVCGG